ncbi:MAG: hypothetical protein GY953_56705 [bacterium]|nr:hypothetical protein [bacterium]
MSTTTGCLFLLGVSALAGEQPLPFAENGTLKMLYDNRAYPQAVEFDGSIYMVWRGERGLPYIRSYGNASGAFSEPYMLLSGIATPADIKRYERDHHFAPVIWADAAGRLHVLFGCHRTPGIHLVSTGEGITGWRQIDSPAESLSYPKLHRMDGDKTLIYYRHQGHLGWWTYRISSDNGLTWTGPERPPVNLSAKPQDGWLADHAGSYHTTRLSADSETLHIAFIWKVENPVPNARYRRTLGDHTQRYNLYYLKVDLASGDVFNVAGKRLEAPVRKRVADKHCLVWDTEERVAAVGPSIYLDENDQPYFVLPVSDETPHRCRFHLVRRQVGEWVRTPIAETSHPFNSSHLTRDADGRFRAQLITGEGESVSTEGMDAYGWGDRVEEWISDPRGENWKLHRDLTPTPGLRYQNIQFVEAGAGVLFYGWRGADTPGTGFLLPAR